MNTIPNIGKRFRFGQSPISSLLSRATLAFALFGIVLSVPAPPINFSLDPVQGFDFEPVAQTPAGFITSMTVGGVTLATDIAVTNPTNTSSTLNVVAVLDSESWGGGVGDPLEFVGRVSTPNRQTIRAMLLAAGTNNTVQFSFRIFNYNPLPPTGYFQAFHPVNNAVLDGLFARSGANAMSVGSIPNSDIPSPQNYTLSISIAPPGIVQNLRFATSPSSGVTKTWGVLTGSAPSIADVTANQITAQSAVLQSTVNPEEANTSTYFEFGTSPTLSTKTFSSTNAVGSGASGVPVSITISNLAAQTTYYYRAVASNLVATVSGSILSFTTVTPSSQLMATLSNGVMQVNFTNVGNAAFSVLATTNLSLPLASWTVIGAPTEILPGQYRFTNTLGTTNLQFYRLRSP